VGSTYADVDIAHPKIRASYARNTLRNDAEAKPSPLIISVAAAPSRGREHERKPRQYVDNSNNRMIGNRRQ
jgi:hypothetical protein